MRFRWVLLVALLAGCSAQEDGPGDVGRDAPPEEGPRFTFLPTEHRGDEPTVGRTSTGTIFVGGAIPDAPGDPRGVLRSTDGGATWTPAVHPAAARHGADPWLYVDAATDRVYYLHLYVGCSWLTWSDDDGATWEVDPRAGCGAPGHDHQHLSGGDGRLYYAYNSLLPAPTPGADLPIDSEGVAVSTSTDGARTWSPRVLVMPRDACHSGLSGAVTVAADGTAYLPRMTCDGVEIAASHDGGATWASVRVDAAGSAPSLSIDPAVVATGEGAHVLFPGRDGAVWSSRTQDAGASWSAPVRLSAPEVNATAFVTGAALADGRIGVFSIATTSPAWDGRNPSFAPAPTRWDVRFAWLGDTDAKVTDDPVQLGCIWLEGTESPCRNLGDFVSATADEGALLFAFTDGCNGCAQAAESIQKDLVVLRVVG